MRFRQIRALLLLPVLVLSAVAYLGCTHAQKTAEVQDAKREPNQAYSGARLVRGDYQKGEVTKLCDQAIQTATTRLNAIAKIPAEQRTIENTLLAFEAITADFGDDSGPLTFTNYTSTDKDVNAEGAVCAEKVGQFGVDIFTRRDLYQALVGQKGRNPDESRLEFKTIEAFEHNGLKLDDQKLAQVKALKTELSKKEVQFATNLNKDTTTVDFTAAELSGVPADAVSNFKKNGDKLTVSTKSTDYVAVMENAKSADTRKKMMLAYMNRAPDNTKILEQAIVLREQIASLLGYKTWADYQIELRMAKNEKTVMTFLNSLKGKLAKRNASDLALLLKYKKELDPSAKTLNVWDSAYYSYQLKKRDYSLDDEKIREYFPADVVVKGMFNVYSQLLSVNYVEVPDAKVWAPGVKLYEIHDKSDNRLIGYFYTDFIPRDGKYGHAAAFPLISGRRFSDGTYSYPVSSIVANFTKPANGKPSLLTHDEVVTVFHEFGHIMHQTLTRAPYASLSGSSVAQDFVEAPSQMLENWVWDPKVLGLLGGHYLDHSKKLPPELLKQMIKARDFNQGMFYTKQLLYGLFDMDLHTQNGPVDATKTYDSLFQTIVGQHPLEGGHFPAGFGHLMGGYDAGYYGYLWSEVYAQDMFSKFPKGNLTDAVTGNRYRTVILEHGNMQDAIVLLKDFLGREPNTKAFFKKLHIH